MSSPEPSAATAPPIVCLFPASAQAGARLRASLPEDALLLERAETDADLALVAAARAHPGRDVVLVDARAELPEHWWPRLLNAREAAPDADLWTPLCALTDALDPRPPGCRLASDAIDRACWLLSDRGHPESAWRSPLLGLWRHDLLRRCAAKETTPRAAIATSARVRLLDNLYVGLADAAASASGAGAHPAASALRARLPTLDDGPLPPAIGLDERPVLLHVLHDWGGGARRFVEDFIRADRRHHHLVLVACGDPGRRMHGERLELRAGAVGPVLRRWPLAAPVAGTRIHSAEYRAALASACGDFRVAGILVSSLIGHSLDALRSGLPTAVVCHDYYPLWPRLHADFGDSRADFGSAAIPAALAAAGAAFEFAERDPAHWQALRAAHVEALQAAGALLIAPSRCVHDNLCRIAPELGALRWQHIAHGLAPWPTPLPMIEPDAQRAALRIVVPGRINGGKGEQLLADLLPRLPRDLELILVGCGSAGMRFFGQPGVHLLLDYRREDLPALLATLRPDAALLPATVAETYSYTLSELRALGVPVIATALGSFVERIRDGVDGLLVAPDAGAVADLLQRLVDDCGPLGVLRRRFDSPSPEQMAAAYGETLALSAPTQAHGGIADPLLLPRAQHGEHAAATAQQEVIALQRQIDAQQLELERRADWAKAEHRQAEERLAWARALEREVEAERLAARTQIDQLEAELDDRSRWARALAAEIEQKSATIVHLDADRDRLNRDLATVIAQRDHFEGERARLLASASWRVTRPLRYARRLLGAGWTRLRFKLSRVLALRQRLLGSLRVRGIGGTLRRLRQELAPAQPSALLDVPSVAAEDGPPPRVDDIVLALPPTPVASIIVPAYNHLQHTLTCLRSLASHPQRAAFEVIVVDDCSQDASAELLPQITGLRYLRNPQNLGFIGACNAGAAAARGEYLVFLNNDTAVQTGWLDALLDTFAAHPDAGLVGAKLVYPDGRLQEAGGIVFSDGSGWNYGRFDDPADPRYGYLRDADYCSGAAIAVPAALFAQLGGFDSHYAPAYYEDTDLAMKVRQAGRRVLYQPASVVVHFEGISSGTDTGSGIKAYQLVNQKKFLARWADTLAGHAAAPPATPIEVARQHRARRRVLVIDATTPQPDQDSGSVRLVNLMRLLVEDGCAVTFFADNRAYLPGYSDALQQLGVEVLWHPWIGDPVSWFSEHGRRFHCVLVSRHYIACSYLDLVRRHAPQARFIFDTVDLHYLREQRAAELSGRADLAKGAEQTRRQELEVIRRSDVTLVVSPVEQALLATDAPGAKVEVLSNVHEVFGSRRPFAERRDLMFIGGFQHPPNIDAATWFVEQVWPLIRARRPGLRFHLIGSKANDDVKLLGEVEGVVFHGFVEDIEPFLDGCRLAVAPLRYGAGVKGKVNMSMSYGQPVVATPMAVEGMHLREGEDVLVAATPEDFAAAVLRLDEDAALWQNLSDNGVANVRAHFGFDAARTVLRRLLD